MNPPSINPAIIAKRSPSSRRTILLAKASSPMLDLLTDAYYAQDSSAPPVGSSLISFGTHVMIYQMRQESHSMLEIRLYGILRSLVEGSSASEETIMRLPYVEGERFIELLHRLGLDVSKVGDCFINGVLAREDSVIHDNDRVGLFPFNMVLIDGGMHMKYHPNRR